MRAVRSECPHSGSNAAAEGAWNVSSAANAASSGSARTEDSVTSWEREASSPTSAARAAATNCGSRGGTDGARPREVIEVGQRVQRLPRLL